MSEDGSIHSADKPACRAHLPTKYAKDDTRSTCGRSTSWAGRGGSQACDGAWSLGSTGPAGLRGLRGLTRNGFSRGLVPRRPAGFVRQRFRPGVNEA